MAAREVSKGTIIAAKGQPLSALHIITQGQVSATFAGGEILLKKGDVIGLTDISYDTNSFTYVARETTCLLSFSVTDRNSLRELILSNPDLTKMLYTSGVGQALAVLSQYARFRGLCADAYDFVQDTFDTYLDYCKKNNISFRSLPQFDNYTRLYLEKDIADWLIGYYTSFRNFSDDIRQALPNYPAYVVGVLYRASDDIHSTYDACDKMNSFYKEKMSVLMAENGVDLFDLYTSLFFRLGTVSPDSEKIISSIDEIVDYIKENPCINTDLIHERVSAYIAKKQGLISAAPSQNEQAESGSFAQEVSGSLDVILEYAEADAELSNHFRHILNLYKKLPDKASSDDNVRMIRNELTNSFYDLYTKAFLKAASDYSVPTILKMFFNFGYVDEELAGIDNACYLYNLAESYKGDADFGVYTAFEWFKAIYSMKKDPSRNEFDVDYIGYLHEQRVQGKITAAEETQLADNPKQRLIFEMKNVFPLVNKVTFGRISSFCPVFTEGNVIKPLPSCLVTPDLISDTISKVLSTDYGAFHRETIYTNERYGIQREYVHVKILPDVILMPNVGQRGIMWQEIEGRKRTTPARFMLSAFHLEDLLATMTRLVGDYRWEMCKRIQGSRWNDVTDKSLTSEYFDYIQFYKKNSDLSTDAKEKIRQGLSKVKNSFKEMFIRDYMTWVMYESTGSPRLNKITRSIMCTYCPFPFEMRKAVTANPLFKETIERYEIKTAQKLHHLDGVINKLAASGVSIPPELAEERAFIAGK